MNTIKSTIVIVLMIVSCNSCVHVDQQKNKELLQDKALMEKVYSEILSIISTNCPPDTTICFTSQAKDMEPIDTALRQKGYATAPAPCDGCVPLNFNIDLYQENNSPKPMILIKIILDGIYYTSGFDVKNGSLIPITTTSRGNI